MKEHNYSYDEIMSKIKMKEKILIGNKFKLGNGCLTNKIDKRKYMTYLGGRELN
jgi:hypothetical protein